MRTTREAGEKFRYLAILSSSLAMLISVSILLAWLLVTDSLSAERHDHLIPAPGTSLLLLVSAASVLLLVHSPSNRGIRYTAVIGGFLTCFYGLLTLSRLMLGWETGMGGIFPVSFYEVNGIPGNYSSPVTAASFLVLGLSIILLSLWQPPGKAKAISSGLSLLAGLNASVVLLAYFFGPPILHNDNIIPMAAFSAGIALLVTIGLLAGAGPDQWPMSLFVGSSLRARLLRVFIPLIMLVGIMEAFVIHVVHHRLTPVNPALVSSSLALFFVVITALFVIRLVQLIGGSYDRAETERSLAEVDLRRSEERFRQLFESSPVSIWEEDLSQVKEYLDKAQSSGIKNLDQYLEENPKELARCASMVKVLNVNRATLEMYEAEDDEALLKNIASTFTQRSLDAFRQALVTACNGETNLHVEAETVTLGGRHMDSIVHWTVVPGFENSLGRVLVSIADITDLKKKETDLWTRTRQLEASQRVAKLGSWEWDLVSDRITWSDELYRVFGLEPQIIEATYEAFIGMAHPDDRVMLDSAVQRAIEKKSDYHAIARFILPDGSDRVMEALGGVTGDEEGNPVLVDGTAQDVTERVNIERELRESEQRYRDLFEGAPDAIFLADPETGMTIGANEAATRLMGRPLEEILEMHQSDMHPDDVSVDPREMFESHVRDSVEEGKVPRAEYEVIRADGTRVPVEIAARMAHYGGRPVFQGTFRDISDRKTIEEALRESEEKYRTLFEESPLALAIHRKGKVINANQAALDLVGATSFDEVIGVNVIDFVHPDSRALAAERMRSVMATGGQAPQTEEKFVKLDGTMIEVEVTAMAIEYQGEPAVQVAIMDVTERKQLEEQLRQAQKMESVGTLAGGIAHDFNNFLTAIEGYIDLSLMDLPPDSPVREELSEARRSADRAASLTRQLLLFSRREPMDLKPCDLSHVIDEMHGMLDRLLGEKYRLETNLKKRVWTVTADMGHMEQVIMNMVVNARDAMPDGGAITVGTENIVIDKDYASEHSEAEPGNYVCMEVADKGAGIEADTLSHIFDPFFSTKSGGEGTGLGLSVVYGIVSQHNGWIDVDSSPGRGSVFRVFIPALPINEENTAIELEQAGELRGNGERVLLVEDENAVRALANRLLSERGYEVYAAADVEEADHIFERENGDFDLVFSDVVLPGEDGISFVGRLRERKPELRVLLASGYSGDESNRGQIREQGFHFMQKPYSLACVMKAISELLSES